MAENLTMRESRALGACCNLADAHPRQSLTSSQLGIVRRFGEIFTSCGQQDYEQVEKGAQLAFLQLSGQATCLNSRREDILSCYSSSVAMEILARALSGRCKEVALVEPTFDSIPDILKGVGLSLRPVGERALMCYDPEEALPSTSDVLFLTTPNNPTGTVIPIDRLLALASVCAARDVLLVMDTSFRLFDQRAVYDQYDVLHRAEVRHVVIEDTGKIWPTQELKAGFLVFSADLALPLRRIHSDILLNVSPFVMMVIREFVADAAGGGLCELRGLIRTNRVLVREALSDVESVHTPDVDSRISVERLLFRTPEAASAVARELLGRGVHVLPGGPFHWSSPEEDSPFLRLALARDTRVLQACLETIAPVVKAVA